MLQHVRRKCPGAKGRISLRNRDAIDILADCRPSTAMGGRPRINKYRPMTAVGSTTPTGPLANAALPMPPYISAAIDQRGKIRPEASPNNPSAPAGFAHVPH